MKPEIGGGGGGCPRWVGVGRRRGEAGRRHEVDEEEVVEGGRRRRAAARGREERKWGFGGDGIESNRIQRKKLCSNADRPIALVVSCCKDVSVCHFSDFSYPPLVLASQTNFLLKNYRKLFKNYIIYFFKKINT